MVTNLFPTLAMSSTEDNSLLHGLLTPIPDLVLLVEDSSPFFRGLTGEPGGGMSLSFLPQPLQTVRIESLLS